VSRLLSVDSVIVKGLQPQSQTSQWLSQSFQRSVLPPTGESPMTLAECMSLFAVVRLVQPHVVVETGVSAGRSSSFLLAALHENDTGELWSIDPDPVCGYAVPMALRKNWHILNGTSGAVLKSVIQEHNVDVFIHDSLHTYENMRFEFETVWPFLSKGGVVLSDDIDRNSAFDEFSRSVNSKRVDLNHNFGAIRKGAD
jgi:hypothetical protein